MEIGIQKVNENVMYSRGGNFLMFRRGEKCYRRKNSETPYPYSRIVPVLIIMHCTLISIQEVAFIVVICTGL